MELDRSELKHQAREAMSATRPPFWLITLLYLLLTSGLYLLLSYLPLPSGDWAMWGSAFFFVGIFFLLYKVVINFGFRLWALWTYRRLNPGAGSLVQGFSVAGRVLLMEIFLYLRMLGWSIVLSVVLLPLVLILSSMVPSLTVLGMGVVYLAVQVMMLRYSMAPFLLADRPDDGPSAAIRRSISLTRGWKWELFKLEFSFVGWILLSTLLSLLALVFCLWQGGFFQALSQIPLQQLPDLFSGYALWQSGVPVDLFGFSTDYEPIYLLFYSIANSLGGALLTQLVAVPVLLWLLPYRLTARAGFYCERLRLQQEFAPPV
ncbi:DUF975 family protein [Flavonifractor sp. An100]|uniref:DUF975 family protein n=1 Tax=Flavonifractor sp. An100 TaxID=1965538 RepID=UPI000B370637|nr:DUF975 family protein [Flavonifractor sp. An100]OUQ76142.1 hypothetical protein B5E43_12440 [Flavonifractor sp. An100]